MTFATTKFRTFLPAATFAMAAEFLMGLSDSVICGHILGEKGLSPVNLMTAIPNRRNLTTTGFNRNVFKL